MIKNLALSWLLGIIITIIVIVILKGTYITYTVCGIINLLGSERSDKRQRWKDKNRLLIVGE